LPSSNAPYRVNPCRPRVWTSVVPLCVLRRCHGTPYVHSNKYTTLHPSSNRQPTRPTRCQILKPAVSGWDLAAPHRTAAQQIRSKRQSFAASRCLVFGNVHLSRQLEQR
jgi:hypothetical protein